MDVHLTRVRSRVLPDVPTGSEVKSSRSERTWFQGVQFLVSGGVHGLVNSRPCHVIHFHVRKWECIRPKSVQIDRL